MPLRLLPTSSSYPDSCRAAQVKTNQNPDSISNQVKYYEGTYSSVSLEEQNQWRQTRKK